MTVRLLRGDCRVTLWTIEAGSVQCAITSPPYYGLRDYGTPPLVWGQTCCEHVHDWQPAHTAGWNPGGQSSLNRTVDSHRLKQASMGERCAHVHDWQQTDEYHNRGDATAGPKQKSNSGSVTGRGVVRYAQCDCGAWLGSLGLEPTPELYIAHLVECFQHVKRVLHKSGTLWLNLGDAYAGSGKGPSNGLSSTAHSGNPHSHLAAQVKQLSNRGSLMPRDGLVPAGYKPKDLMLLPFRAALALQADGWYVRSVIPWLKRNSMPESVRDRPTTSVEYVFLLSKSRTYWFDVEAVRAADSGRSSGNGFVRDQRLSYGRGNDDEWVPGKGRQRRAADWFFESWQGLLLGEQDNPLALVVNPSAYAGAHFAVFPPRLVEPMVQASTRPGEVVLDPFGGSGTVGMVADRLGRNAVLCELSADYGQQAIERVVGDAPLFAQVEAS